MICFCFLDLKTIPRSNDSQNKQMLCPATCAVLSRTEKIARCLHLSTCMGLQLADHTHLPSISQFNGERQRSGFKPHKFLHSGFGVGQERHKTAKTYTDELTRCQRSRRKALGAGGLGENVCVLVCG